MEKLDKTFVSEINPEVTLRIFSLENPKDTFTYPSYVTEDDFVDVNWNTDDPSEALVKQLKISFYAKDELEWLCQDEDYSNLKILINKNRNQYEDYSISDEKLMKETCDKFLDSTGRFSNVFGIDGSMFRLIENENLNVKIHVVVALHNNQYLGHIYAFIGPTGKNCSMIGIRSNPTMIFQRMIGKGIRNIASILVEGVNYFGYINGAQRLVIISPIGHMNKIAKDLGFKKEKVKKSEIGDAASYSLWSMSGDVCKDCLIKPIQIPQKNRI